MNIVLAFDSFKGSLSAVEVCAEVKETLLSYNQDYIVTSKPLADGGEGSLDVIASQGNFEVISKEVMGPFPEKQVLAKYLYSPENKNIFIEMAEASGLPLLKDSERDPLKATTYGTGELIKDALQYDPKRIYLAVGGSATNDLGIGAAQALGWQFLDANEKSVGLEPASFNQIKTIVKNDQLKLPEIIVLSDVQNPLCGPSGASYVYGPQKGASQETCEILDQTLLAAANLIKDQLGKDILDLPGAGSAGGLGAGAVAFFDAEIKSGIDSILDLTEINAVLKNADWILTGEGRLDTQSISGKVITGLLNRKNEKTKLGVICGSSLLKDYTDYSIDCVFQLSESGMSLEECIAKTPELLKARTLEFCENYG